MSKINEQRTVSNEHEETAQFFDFCSMFSNVTEGNI